MHQEVKQALGHAEVEIENLEDLIEEAEDNGNERKVAQLKRCLTHWVECTCILEKMLFETVQTVGKEDVVVVEGVDVATDILTGKLLTGAVHEGASSITSV